MGLKRKIARYIKIIWVRTKSETVFLYPECMERCLKTKIMEEEEEEKGETIFFFLFQAVENLVCFIQDNFEFCH